ncbi:hypothetical protein CHGG_05957 [Chaetomium globosum CBS 148.51]|uniref:Transcription initiation factor IIF subunit beta n=1 Tax=Chaetomium globosum (strain ATCC 6205 / CBS 148.51 / DSM 1962 / NBRC 6347 / NRRL 1970) TaxID=306901 RepID=Q2H5V8_CHAGB|nr:uncharacterized protein CHGG_05957 [Chaetomium globosum CBS 148.51]EAQ89338.1 hypothetical protein CHGG_05957 [Chaetomium globosum CBS 148.51]
MSTTPSFSPSRIYQATQPKTRKGPLRLPRAFLRTSCGNSKGKQNRLPIEAERAQPIPAGLFQVGTSMPLPSQLNPTNEDAEKTKIAGRIRHEVVCTPVRNAEADRFLSIRAARSQRPHKKVTVLHGIPPSGDTTNPHEWDDFLKTKEKPTKAKKMENKATRWPENQLLDAIARCFSEHKYWSIKAFRGKIPQPEAYLRETLEKVAVLHRSGTFANHWSLKPEYQGILASLPKPADDAAVPKADAPSEDEDEEDIKMEDVL